MSLNERFAGPARLAAAVRGAAGRRAALILLASATTLGPAHSAGAATGAPDPSGAMAGGYAWGTFIVGCETCPQFPIPLTGNPISSAGGPGAASATVSYTGGPDPAAAGEAFSGYTLFGTVELAAVAAFDAGALRLPLLGARAAALNHQVFTVEAVNPTPDFAGIDVYSAEGRARTLMRYTWLGAEDATFTFNFRVHGTVEDQRSSIFGSAAFFTVDDFEVPLAINSALLQGADGFGDISQALDQTFALSLTFTPGSSAVLQSTLTAAVFSEYASGYTFADAMSTMSVTSVAGGDTSLLAASPVPLPATALPLLSGLGLLLASGRRRARAPG